MKDDLRFEPGCGSIMKGFSLLVVLILTLAPGACSRSRTVYIPPEWKGSPAREPAIQQRPGASVDSPAQQSPGAVFKTGPGFKESNLPSASEAPVAPGAAKKVEAMTPEQQSPQRLASLHLVEQGKAALNQGKPDAAIPLFEQAIQVDAHSGEGFFGLAKAWRTKGSRNKAQEFARKAEILFQDNPARLKEVWLFLADLFKELGDTKKMEFYRDKASKL